MGRVGVGMGGGGGERSLIIFATELKTGIMKINDGTGNSRLELFRRHFNLTKSD